MCFVKLLTKEAVGENFEVYVTSCTESTLPTGAFSLLSDEKTAIAVKFATRATKNSLEALLPIKFQHPILSVPETEKKIAKQRATPNQ